MIHRNRKSLGIAALLLAAIPAWLATAQDPTAPTKQTVRLPHVNPPVGASMHSESSRHLEATIQILVGGNVAQEIQQVDSEVEVKDVTILGADENGEPNAARFHYVKSEKSHSQNGIEMAQPQPHVGKTYVVTHSEGEYEVAYEEGDAEPSDEEKETVIKDAKGLFDGGIEDLLPDRDLEMGEVIKPEKEKVVKALHLEDEAMAVEEFTLSPAEIKEVDGAKRLGFKVHIKFSGEPQPGLKITMVQDGMQWFDLKTGAPLGGDLAGPMTVSGGQALPNGQGQMEFKGAGKQTMTGKNTIKMPE